MTDSKEDTHENSLVDLLPGEREVRKRIVVSSGESSAEARLDSTLYKEEA